MSSVDKQIHDKLAEFARQVANRYGVTIESVRFDWVSTMAGDHHLVNTSVTTDKNA